MAVVTAFADVDVATGKAQRAVNGDAFIGFGRVGTHHQRDEFDETADADRQDDQHDHEIQAFFDGFMAHC